MRRDFQEMGGAMSTHTAAHGRTLQVVVLVTTALCVAAAGAHAGQGPQQQPSLGELSLEELLQTKVVLASQQPESLQEAPVPMTVITRDMIRAIGARTLQDVLTIYVPGMTMVTDHNEVNVAMRGIYASSQQKILIMLDGHRLNSRAYSMAAPDYSIRIDLERVKQIEVLRGPGSSLYGNIALTAVVNIVTESGGAIDGLAVTVAAGGFASGLDAAEGGHGALAAGQNVGFTYGKGFSATNNLVLWGGWFSAEGQHIPVARAQDYSPTPQDGYAHVAAFRQAPSYDFGVRYRTGMVTVLANRRYGKLVEPFTSSGGTGEVYDRARFRTIQGEGPGLGSRSNHAEIKFSPSLSPNLSLELTGYYDTNEVAGQLISSGSRANSSFINWLDDAMGGVAQATRKYRSRGGLDGTILVGAQIDRMRLTDSSLPVQRAGEWVGFGDSHDRPLLEPGRETVYSIFSQVKHRFNERWLVNNGIRFDIKDRHRGPNITNISPRLAVVFVPTDRFDVKMSYSTSFVDAPYWYRYNVFPSYQGSENLRPEYLRSLQVTPSFNFFGGRLRNSLNLFHNDAKDFVFRNNDAAPTAPKYINAGLLSLLGVEDEIAWIGTTVSVRGVLTYQRANTFQNFNARGNEVFSVPRFQGNVVVDVKPAGVLRNKAAINLTLRYVGSQLSPISPTFKLDAAGLVSPFEDPDYRTKRCVVANAGVRVLRAFAEQASLSATAYNLFDSACEQGGSVVHPYPQAGRSIVVGLTLKLASPKP